MTQDISWNSTFEIQEFIFEYTACSPREDGIIAFGVWGRIELAFGLYKTVHKCSGAAEQTIAAAGMRVRVSVAEIPVVWGEELRQTPIAGNNQRLGMQGLTCHYVESYIPKDLPRTISYLWEAFRGLPTRPAILGNGCFQYPNISPI